MKEYKFTTFRDKIEINLANISSSKDDQFRLFRVYYDHNLFTCELCGHQHCCYAFEIQNIQTGKILKIGSECVNHFEGKGIDLDLAEGLIKRIMKATAEARDELRMKLGNEEWEKLPSDIKSKFRSWQIDEYKKKLGNEIMKKMSRAEKASLTAQMYLVIQAKELLRDFSINRAFIDEDQVKQLFEMGLAEKYEEAKAKRAKAVEYDEYVNYKREVFEYFNGLKNDWSDPDSNKILEFGTKIVNNRYSIDLNYYITNYNVSRNRIKNHPILMNYKGNNPIVKRAVSIICMGGYLGHYEFEQVKQIIESEKDPELTKQIQAMIAYILLKNHNNEYVNEINFFFKDHGFINNDQFGFIESLYNELKDRD